MAYKFNPFTGMLDDTGLPVDTDTSLTANSDSKIASQKAVKAYADGLGNASILQPYWDKLAANTAVTAFIGDSITYGLNNTITNPFKEKFQNIVMSRYGGIGTNFVPASTAGAYGAVDASRGLVGTGTLTELALGMGGTAIGTNSSGVSLTYTSTQNCTEIGIWYGKAPTYGKLKITVDGGTPTIIDTGNATLSWGNKWSSGALTSGIHSIKVEGTTGGALNAGYSTAVEAFFTDSATTPRLIGAYKQGNTTARYTQAVNPHWQDGFANAYPDAVVIHLGTNDSVSSTTAATYKANLQEIVTTLNALATPPSVILIGNMAQTNYLSGATWTAYQAAVKDIVANTPNAIEWNIQNDLGNNQAPNYGNVYAAGVHPNAYGHSVMANSIAKLILPPYNDYQETKQVVSNALVNNLAIVASTVSASGGFTGNITGNVSGNVTGSLTGNVSGGLSQALLQVTGSRDVAVSDYGKTLYYSGSSDIALNFTSAVVNGYLYAAQFNLLMMGTGSVTITGTAITINGVNKLTRAGQKLTLMPYDSSNVTSSLLASDVTPPPRVNTLAVSGSTYTVDVTSTDTALIVSPTANFTVATSGTPVDGQKLVVRLNNGATAYTPTWNSIFMSSGLVSLPTTLTASKINDCFFVYVGVRSKWVLMAYDAVGF